MVPEAGVEPAWSKLRGILSPLRLPVSPLRHEVIDMYIYLSVQIIFSLESSIPASLRPAGTEYFRENDCPLQARFFFQGIEYRLLAFL